MDPPGSVCGLGHGTMAPVPSGQQCTSRMKPVAMNARRPVPASLVPAHLPSTESGGCLSLSGDTSLRTQAGLPRHQNLSYSGVYAHGVAVCSMFTSNHH